MHTVIHYTNLSKESMMNEDSIINSDESIRALDCSKSSPRGAAGEGVAQTNSLGLAFCSKSRCLFTPP